MLFFNAYWRARLREGNRHCPFCWVVPHARGKTWCASLTIPTTKNIERHAGFALFISEFHRINKIVASHSLSVMASKILVHARSERLFAQ